LVDDRVGRALSYAASKEGITVVGEPINLYAAAGLVYDIVGAIVLAEAIVGSRTEILVRQARHRGQFSTGNLSLFGALDDQRHDARFGLASLIVGFGLQLLAALGSVAHLDGLGVVMFSAPLIVGLCAWQISACRLAATRLPRFLDSLESRLR
jgi:hypothetical protein